jgi:putative endonuclease
MIPRNNYDIGVAAEGVAKKFLASLGYAIVAGRMAAVRGTDSGEIDIIAAKGRTLAFIEVKKRATHAIAAESISPSQQRRIARAAEVFLARNPEYAGYDCRFDAILIDEAGGIEHLENAWMS